MQGTVHPLFQQYIDSFQTGEYYACHEYAEELWLMEGRPRVLKGFIQAAVCLYHLERGNIRGAVPMWQRARTYLQDGMPVYALVQTEKLVVDLDEVFHNIPHEWKGCRVQPDLVSALHLPRVYLTVIVHNHADSPMTTEDKI